MKVFKYLLTSSLFISGIGFVSADASSFLVEVSPSTFKVNEAVDLSISAIDSNGQVVKTYEGDVLMTIEELNDLDNYTLPLDGVDIFEPKDQGVKKYSKGLVVKKAGTYTLKIEDVVNSSLVGKTTIIVDGGGSTATQNITISSPTAGSVEKGSTVNVIGSSPLPNSPLEIYINGTKVKEDTTNANGDFVIYLSNMISGSNTLQVKILDLSNKVIGESKETQFTYQVATDAFFKSMLISPSKILTGGSKMTFTVMTDPGVSSAELSFSNGQIAVPMDKVKDGEFTKTATMDKIGSALISLTLTSNGQRKNYDAIESISITQPIVIAPEVPAVTGTTIPVETPVVPELIKIFDTVKTDFDAMDKNKAIVSRTLTGVSGLVVSGYNVQYGTSESMLTGTMFVTGTVANFTVPNDVIWYVQIFPIGIDGTGVALPSEIISLEVPKPSAPLCTIQGIMLRTEQVGDTYFFVRDPVENVEKYEIYRSEDLVSTLGQMTKVGETVETKFQYPFDPMAANKEYAYYAIQAVCKDGGLLQIDSVKKIQVGPYTNIAIILFISLLGYFGYRMLRERY